MVRTIVFVVFAIFTTFSGYVSWHFGYSSAFPPFKDLPTTQIFWDLVIALSIVLHLFYRDLKRRKQPMWPLLLCAVGIILLGSISPLLFLLLRKDLRDGAALPA